MRTLAPIVLAAALAGGFTHAGAADQKPPRPAASQPPAGPRRIGTFDDWTAATNAEAGQTVCYAFARALSSAPPISGRGGVILTVTQRASGRDAVALSAGFAYAPGAVVTAQTDQANLSFYTAHRSAFARDGRAAVAAMQKARDIVLKSPAPRGGQVTDRFSLRGFSAAYIAIGKACPPK
jgi:invasion protein IalB